MASAAVTPTARTRPRRLSSRARKLLLTTHVIASVGLIGSSAGTLGVALIAAGAEPATDAHVLYSADQTLIFALAIPLSAIALITGLALGLRTHWGVLRHTWVTAKLGLLLMVIVNGALVIRPLIGHLVDVTSSATSQDPGSARWAMPAAVAVNIVFTIAAAGLATFKPGGRLRPDRNS